MINIKVTATISLEKFAALRKTSEGKDEVYFVGGIVFREVVRTPPFPTCTVAFGVSSLFSNIIDGTSRQEFDPSTLPSSPGQRTYLTEGNLATLNIDVNRPGELGDTYSTEWLLHPNNLLVFFTMVEHDRSTPAEVMAALKHAVSSDLLAGIECIVSSEPPTRFPVLRTIPNSFPPTTPALLAKNQLSPRLVDALHNAVVKTNPGNELGTQELTSKAGSMPPHDFTTADMHTVFLDPTSAGKSVSSKFTGSGADYEATFFLSGHVQVSYLFDLDLLKKFASMPPPQWWNPFPKGG